MPKFQAILILAGIFSWLNVSTFADKPSPSFLFDFFSQTTVTTQPDVKETHEVTTSSVMDARKLSENNESQHCGMQNIFTNNNITLVLNFGGNEKSGILLGPDKVPKNISQEILAGISTIISTKLPELLTTTEKPFRCDVPLASEFPQFDCNILNMNFSKPITNKEQLMNVLEDPFVHIIKFPVSEGRVNERGPKLPLVGNKGQFSGDLDLDEAFHLVSKHNDAGFIFDKKAIELIFPNTLFYRAALVLVKKWYPKFNSLLILSADILDKSGSKEKPVEPELFLIGGKRFKKATLSLGWTSDGAESSYSDEEINEMSNIVKKYKVIQPLTFRMNVLRAVNNLNGVARLIYSKPSTTLSLFSRDSERVGVKNLNELVKTFGANKIYLSGLQNANKKLEAYLLWLKP